MRNEPEFERMELQKGDYVTRKSHDHDTVFKIMNIKDDTYYLKGVDVRLYADALEDDLVKLDKPEEEENFIEKVRDNLLMDRSEFFYLPGRVLHIDGDGDYLNRCLNFYKEANIMAVGKMIKEDDIAISLRKLLDEIKPDIVIITGHDAFFKKKGDTSSIANYKNSENFIKAVREARRYEKSHEKLVIIAGACQSNYEELIKAGANYASSPKRVNIHCLDPAIIAVSVALTERSKEVDLINLLDKTKYGKDGMGGIMSNGLMYVGYPR